MDPLFPKNLLQLKKTKELEGKAEKGTPVNEDVTVQLDCSCGIDIQKDGHDTSIT
jgi:hypothetical protein